MKQSEQIRLTFATYEEAIAYRLQREAELIATIRTAAIVRGLGHFREFLFSDGLPKRQVNASDLMIAFHSC